LAHRLRQSADLDLAIAVIESLQTTRREQERRFGNLAAQHVPKVAPPEPDGRFVVSVEAMALAEALDAARVKSPTASESVR